MANILEIAKYIVQKQGEMTSMKLEKLAYYCQAWSLAWEELPLFDEDFQAWANGPVCPELFRMHKGIYKISDMLFKDVRNPNLNDDQIDTIEKVLEYYGDKSPHWLSELTHKERPWRIARAGVPDGEPCKNIITKESMMEYYGGLHG